VARPTGTVTFLFSDVEGSTRQWEADAAAADAAFAEHDALLGGLIDRHRGYVFARSGDGFAVAFARASDAIGAAVETQHGLAASVGGLRVRIGLHTGEAVEREGDYFGPAVNRAARIMAAGHGGQVLLSDVTADLVPGIDTVDLGEHALAGIDGRVGIRQLVIDGLRVSFPPLRSSHETPTNLPNPRTSFVGRDEEVERVIALLATGQLVTLVGTGGAGKTRLAVEAARRCVASFGDGVWFAGLADVVDAELVASTVAQAMGRHDPLVPAVDTAMREHLVRSIGTSRLLLVLDNCEHVLGACAELLTHLLDHCGGLVVLATSREPLGLAGEQLVEVGSLEQPGDDSVSAVLASAAGSLFVERAQSVRAGFSVTDDNAATVAVLCRRLAGLPLAVELAAARCRVLTPAQLIERLDGAFGVLGASRNAVKHHETLRATLAWSYDLLDDSEQRLFRHLGVFRGGLRLEAAEAVSAAEDRAQVLDDLASLIDKSMVDVAGEDPDGARRYVLLEVVREYALMLLVEHGERPGAEQRHGEHLLSACSEVGASERGSPRWRVLRAELDNVRSAAGWARDQGNAAAALNLINTYPCWLDSGLLRERVELVTTTIDRAGSAALPSASLAAALGACCVNMSYLGDEEGAQRANLRLTSLLAEHPDDLSVRGGWAFALATQESWFAGHDLLSAHHHMAEAQACNDAAQMPNAYPAANQALFALCFGVDPPDGFAMTIDAALSRARLAGGPVLELTVLAMEAVYEVFHGDHAAMSRAAAHHAEVLAVGSDWEGHLLSQFVGLGWEHVGHHERSATAVLDYLGLVRASGIRVLLPSAFRAAARRCSERDPRQAARLWGAASQLAATTGMRDITALAERDTELRDECRQQFSTSELDDLHRDGQRWTLNQVLDTARAELAPR
jgi:predicted ATPase/class 3 adenylate cyclase